MEAAGCSDESLATDLMQGFPLTGPIFPAGTAPPACHPAGCSESELLGWAHQSNYDVLRRARRPAVLDPGVRQAFEQKAEEEVSAGDATSARRPFLARPTIACRRPRRMG